MLALLLSHLFLMAVREFGSQIQENLEDSNIAVAMDSRVNARLALGKLRKLSAWMTSLRPLYCAKLTAKKERCSTGTRAKRLSMSVSAMIPLILPSIMAQRISRES